MNDREVTLLAHDMGEYFKISPDLLDSGDAVQASASTSRGDGVVISNNLAFRSNLKLGDTITIRSPKGDLSLPVVGMLKITAPNTVLSFSTGSFIGGIGMIAMSITFL